MLLGKVLQTVGEREWHFIMMVMLDISHCSVLWFLCMSVCACKHLSPTMAVVTTMVGEQGDDMSQRACTGSVATKLRAVTWLVEAAGPHTILFALMLF